MGPTNVALVKLFRADQALRDARERLDVATKNVRVQERRTNDVAEKLKLAQVTRREHHAKGTALELDLKSRDAHLEKLREQQQAAKNNKEYQTYLVEINTLKVDKTKVEEETMAAMELAEATGREVAELTTILDSERVKLETVKGQIGDNITQLQAEIDTLVGPRDAIAAALPAKARLAFDKLADHHDGEALSALLKPDRRKEEYACSACMMDLVTDVYNKLHTRDDLVYCPSCRRILYVPTELPPDMAVNKKGATRTTGGSKATKGEAAGVKSQVSSVVHAPSRPKDRIGQILTAAQGESVKNAVDADQKSHEFHVTVDGRVIGIYRGKNADNLERVVRFRFEEAGLKHEVHVNPVVHDTPQEPAAASPDVEPGAAPTPEAEQAAVAAST